MLAVMASPTAVSASTSQMWYLDSEEHRDYPSTGLLVMEREKPGEQSGTVTIGAGESQLWLADEAAACDVTITGGIWLIKLHTSDIKRGDIDAIIGYYDKIAGEFYEFGPRLDFGLKFFKNWIEIEFHVDPQTIPEGQYLALKVENIDPELNPHTIDTAGEGIWEESWLRSPCSDPGYPVPELPAAILLGVGLLGLVGYLGVRRCRVSS